MSRFTEIKIHTSHEGAELVADLLSEYSSDGVAVSDPQDVIDLENSGRNWDYKEEGVSLPAGEVFVSGYIPEDGAKKTLSEIKERLSALKAASPFDMGALDISVRETDGDLWKKVWKERFRPIHIGKVTVVPQWTDYKAAEGETAVIIGSDMAFGTGEHETTAMCIEYLQKYVKAGDTVIDVGCGSGILGICAALLGAGEAILTDTDECAVEAAEKNAKANGVTGVRIEHKNLLDGESAKGDVIVCNITAEPLIAFAPHIGAHLKEGGVIILSGILNDRLSKVEAAYTAAGFKFTEHKTAGEWSACVFTKAAE